ncbi:MAK10-like protein [Tanacetum coccineum]
MLNIGIVEETKIIIGLADGSKAYPTGVVKEAEVSIGRLKFLVDFYVLAVDKDPTCPLLVGREFLATASEIIDCRRSQIAAKRSSYDPRPCTDFIGPQCPFCLEETFMSTNLPAAWEIARDAELNPFKDAIVFRKVFEFLGAIPITLMEINGKQKTYYGNMMFSGLELRGVSVSGSRGGGEWWATWWCVSLAQMGAIYRLTTLGDQGERAQVDQGSQIKMIQVKEMMQDNDLKNSKSKDKGSKSRSQSMDEQIHYKQDKTITRQSINVKRHIFNVIGGTEEFEERDLNIGGDC